VSAAARRAFRSITHALFDLGVVIKGVGGALQLVAGALLAVSSPERVGHVAAKLTHEDLPSCSRTFVVAYLVVHGVVKMGLAWSLLRGRLWAYPTAMIVFALFGVWQIDRWITTRSGWMLALTVLDAFVIALTWLEWGRHGGGVARVPRISKA